MRGITGGILAASLFLGLSATVALAQGHDFDLAISFDPDAAAKLAELGEGVVVSAYYYGEPTADGQAKADQTVTLIGSVDDGALQWVVDGQPRVNVNVFSARKSSPDNILNCGIFEDFVAAGQASVPQISCKLN